MKESVKQGDTIELHGFEGLPTNKRAESMMNNEKEDSVPKKRPAKENSEKENKPIEG